jgi:hypothetical protein
MPQAGEVEISVCTPRTLLKAGQRSRGGIDIVSLVRRALWTVAAVVVLAAGATWGGLAWRHHATYGTVVGEDQKSLTVDRGDRFSLAVPDRGASVGDSWSAAVVPQAALASAGNRKVLSSLVDRIFGPLAGGGAGMRYFIYTAEREGSARVTLSNCFQGCYDVRTRAASRTVAWVITIR